MNKEGERTRGRRSQRRCDLSVFVAHFRVPSVCDVFSLCGACAEGAAAEAAASAGDGSVCLRVEGLRGLLSGEELRLPCMNAHNQAHVFVQAGGGGASSTEPLSVGGACGGVEKWTTVYGMHLLPPGDDCLRPGEGLRRRPAGEKLRRRPAGDGLRLRRSRGSGYFLSAKPVTTRTKGYEPTRRRYDLGFRVARSAFD